MNHTPNPCPRVVSASDETVAMRRFDCRTYSDCLATAAKARWSSWSCDNCQAFCQTPRVEPKLRRGSSLSFEGR